MNQFYSNGKLLLTGEYLVLDGVKSLAVPTKFGQDLVLSSIQEPQLIWSSFTASGACWFEAVFDLPKLRLVNCTFESDREGSAEFIGETLQTILQEARKLNPEFLNSDAGFEVKTNLSFPTDWGLGSSSTLIHNIALWAQVDPYSLLWNAFSGSGYDIACAQHDTPIFYQLENRLPIVTPINFNPSFTDQLFFVHLNKKQNSREGIEQYKKNNQHIKQEIAAVSNLSGEFAQANSIKELDKIIEEHEKLISSIIKLKKIKEIAFPDYFGAVKSLGAWGGDFVLATGNEDTPKYFKQKGFETVLTYKEMVL